ncbi:hypothetical protein DSO57_1039227 [Entomophthora muscae]|uniref:Uncharacterized protein n=1 Tax=Entomophthora muscae TaxID=34485 RepID=A0ACC2TX62_9FUNG|nr:hypothetical protein DSO57_1039227 [Entomophthora muscae]
MKSFIALVVLASIAFECESKGIRFPLRSTLPTAQQHLKGPTTQPQKFPNPPSRAHKEKEGSSPNQYSGIQRRNPKSKNLPVKEKKEARKKKEKRVLREDDEIPTGDDSPDEEAEAEDKPKLKMWWLALKRMVQKALKIPLTWKRNISGLDLMRKNIQANNPKLTKSGESTYP